MSHDEEMVEGADNEHNAQTARQIDVQRFSEVTSALHDVMGSVAALHRDRTANAGVC